MTLGGELARATRRLMAAGVPDAGLDAEWLLAGALGVDRATLFTRRQESLEREVAERFEGWLERRVRREPLQHVLGEQEFYGRRFASDRRALIPRPETETLVDAVLALPPHLGAPLERGPRLCDAGTGSGCVAITLAAERPDWSVDAIDASPDALALAGSNVERHGLGERVQLERMRFDELLHRAGAYDAIVSNPPYVAESEWDGLQPEVRDFDPRDALVSGVTGLEAYGLLSRVASVALRPGGWLALEVGFGQAPLVERILADRGFVESARRDDLSGTARVVTAQRPERG